MRSGGGKNKGSSFERDICRKLTKFVTGSEKPEIFWRSASSGAKATQDAKSGVKGHMGGDIVSVQDSQGMWLTEKFSIECKSYADFFFDHLFTPGKGQIWKWWDQCRRDADDANKRPMLIFKKNRSPIYVMLAQNSDLCYLVTHRNIPFMYMHGDGGDLYVYEFEKLFGEQYNGQL